MFSLEEKEIISHAFDQLTVSLLVALEKLKETREEFIENIDSGEEAIKVIKGLLELISEPEDPMLSFVLGIFSLMDEDIP